MNERYYIYHADDINAQLCDSESDFNIHVDEILNEELLNQLCNILNEKENTIKMYKEALDNG